MRTRAAAQAEQEHRISPKETPALRRKRAGSKAGKAASSVVAEVDPRSEMPVDNKMEDMEKMGVFIDRRKGKAVDLSKQRDVNDVEQSTEQENETVKGADAPKLKRKRTKRDEKGKNVEHKELKSNEKIKEAKGGKNLDKQVKDREREQQLTSRLFTTSEGFFSRFNQEAQDIEDKKLKDSEATDEDDSDHEPPKAEEKVVWQDDEDTQEIDISDPKKRNQARLRKLRKTKTEESIKASEMETRLRDQFVRLHGEKDWAQVKKKSKEDADENDDDLELIRTADKLTKNAAKEGPLRQKEIDLNRVTNANKASPSEAVIQCTQFHKGERLFLTAGYDKKVRLFDIDGIDNPCLQSVYMHDLPVRSAFFAGNEVVMTGRRPFFYSYDMMSGTLNKVIGVKGRDEKSLEHALCSPDEKTIAVLAKDGTTLMISAATKQLLYTLKMNGSIRGGAFGGSDSDQFFTCGGDGEIYWWDLKQRKCVAKWRDEGSIKSGCISISPDGKHLGVSSGMGIVNLYSTPLSTTFGSVAPSPRKVVDNLVTTVTQIKFHPSSELAAIASPEKKDALKLVHVTSGSVFANWPSKRTPLSYVTSVSFNNQFIAIGNDKGKVLLYRLNHYA